MSLVTWARLAACVCVLGAGGCGDDDDPATPRRPHKDPDAGDEFVCVDKDGDGFGRYCEAGTDCDDEDATISDECTRCVQPRIDCACTPGTKPIQCDPPDKHVAGGMLVCSEGTRYCRDGFWGDCETIGQYIFVPSR